ncbi:MAG: hypothetical protein EGP73_07420 [Alistipes indistinctus]|nr:hypothetical protein [Alistipes indistinctus]
MLKLVLRRPAAQSQIIYQILVLFPAARHSAKRIRVADWFRRGTCQKEQWFQIIYMAGTG